VCLYGEVFHFKKTFSCRKKALTIKMGNNNSVSYPGYNLDKDKKCFNKGWITEPGLGIDKISDPYLKKIYIKMLDLSSKFKLLLPEEKAWWFLRWAYFEVNGHQKDARARTEFLKIYFENSQKFLSYDEAVKKCNQNKNELLVILDDTIPGNLILMVTDKKDGKFRVYMYNINQIWMKSKPSLNEIARDLFPGVMFHQIKK
jgi:hypothetical protein